MISLFAEYLISKQYKIEHKYSPKILLKTNQKLHTQYQSEIFYIQINNGIDY
jgi:hypothetical protein